MYISVFVKGFRSWRGRFWLLNENLTFKGPEAQQTTAVERIGVNKIPPNLKHHLRPILEAIWLFKGLSVRPHYRPFGVKGLILYLNP
jgi:hypothetical protein